MSAFFLISPSLCLSVSLSPVALRLFRRDDEPHATGRDASTKLRARRLNVRRAESSRRQRIILVDRETRNRLPFISLIEYLLYTFVCYSMHNRIREVHVCMRMQIEICLS